MGDGRHRQDPGGHGRYLVAASGILIVLALLATGGYALYSVLTTESGQQGSASLSAPQRGEASALGPGKVVKKPAPGRRSGPPTVALRVTGPRSYVSVRLPGGKVLLNKTLQSGETARFYQRRLLVTVGDPDAVRTRVNGDPRDPSKQGLDTFTVSRKG